MDFLPKLAHWQTSLHGHSFALWTDYHRGLDQLTDHLTSSLGCLYGEIPQTDALGGVIFFSITGIFECIF